MKVKFKKNTKIGNARYLKGQIVDMLEWQFKKLKNSVELFDDNLTVNTDKSIDKEINIENLNK